MALKVLLADDSVPAQNMGKKILTDAGYEVLTVGNGLEALRKICDIVPDIAILDIFMPGYTGLEICARLRSSASTAELPIILTVGKLEPYRPEDGEEVRANAVIVKPFDAVELTSAVRSLMGGPLEKDDSVAASAVASPLGELAEPAAKEESAAGDRVGAAVDAAEELSGTGQIPESSAVAVETSGSVLPVEADSPGRDEFDLQPASPQNSVEVDGPEDSAESGAAAGEFVEAPVPEAPVQVPVVEAAKEQDSEPPEIIIVEAPAHHRWGQNITEPAPASQLAQEEWKAAFETLSNAAPQSAMMSDSEPGSGSVADAAPLTTTDLTATRAAIPSAVAEVKEDFSIAQESRDVMEEHSDLPGAHTPAEEAQVLEEFGVTEPQDEVPTDVATPGGSYAGLHAVERNGGPDSADFRANAPEMVDPSAHGRSELIAEVAKVEALLVQMQAMKASAQAEHGHTANEFLPNEGGNHTPPPTEVPWTYTNSQAMQEEAPREVESTPANFESEPQGEENAPTELEPAQSKTWAQETALVRGEAQNEAERIRETVEKVFDRFRPLLVAAIVRELARLD